jgi:hypothetical protein
MMMMMMKMMMVMMVMKGIHVVVDANTKFSAAESPG